MQERFFRLATVLLILLVAALLAQPYLDRLLFAATSPRAITTRSDLPESERATIGLFERVSPSVVQVVGVATSSGTADVEGEGVREQSGTGFVWDDAGHVVTNNHVVSASRASGNPLRHRRGGRSLDRRDGAELRSRRCQAAKHPAIYPVPSR